MSICNKSKHTHSLSEIDSVIGGKYHVILKSTKPPCESTDVATLIHSRTPESTASLNEVSPLNLLSFMTWLAFTSLGSLSEHTLNL
jgi:hypothetical protein